MKRSFVCFLTFFLCLIMISTCFSVAEADNEPIETLISTVIQSSYPGCQLFDYAPIGQEKTEYIVIAVDSEEMPAVMIVNTEQPSAGVEFCNYRILEGIPLDRNNLQIIFRSWITWQMEIPICGIQIQRVQIFCMWFSERMMKVYGLSMKHSLEMNGVNCIGSNTATKISSSIFSFPGMI